VGRDGARAQSGQHRWWAFIALHIASALVMIAVMATVPEPSGKVALVYWPTATATEAFRNAAAAGGRAIRFGNVPWIVIAAPEPDDRDFFARARATGAHRGA